MPASPLLIAMKRGFRRRCPSCGRAPLFRGYVKVVPVCPACGADNGRHRVDDAASYFTVLLVGHLVVAPLLVAMLFWDAPVWELLAVMLPAVGLVTLGALPFVKGAILGALAAQARRARAEAVRPSPVDADAVER